MNPNKKAMPRLEEAATISPGQSSGAKRKNGTLGNVPGVSCTSCKDSYILIALCSCSYRALVCEFVSVTQGVALG